MLITWQFPNEDCLAVVDQKLFRVPETFFFNHCNIPFKVSCDVKSILIPQC